jgi:hypothetical protein
LELLAAEAPDVLSDMRALAKEGRVAFYNGTYAQPHLQILSPEANIRQFEYGAEVYRELCDYSVVTYAHQETSIHDQSPQLMSTFGIRYSALPHFPATVAWLDGGEVVTRKGRPHFIHAQEFVWWVGLDGTKLPLYLNPARLSVNDWVAEQTIFGLTHQPPILLENRDLPALDESAMEQHPQVEMVLLDEAFAKRIAQAPPEGQARHFTYWSYIEGIRAEELCRSNWIAETSALRAEALNSMAFALLKRPVESTRQVWKTILASQHHDAYCFCAPELREKAIGWLRSAALDTEQLSAGAMSAIAAAVNTQQHEGLPVVVFNAVPHAQAGIVSLAVAKKRPNVINSRGESLPAEVLSGADGSSTVKFLATFAGFGYETYWLSEGEPSVQETETNEAFFFENDYYRASVQADATLTSLIIKPSGAELLAHGPLAGNTLMAADSTGLSPKLSPGIVDRQQWQLPAAGPELRWKSLSPARLRRSPLGLTVSVSGQMGEHVRASLTINFYFALQRIDFSYIFDFDTASLGVFYLDETKLRVHWPLAFRGAIQHDIPFGVVQTREERPIYPSSWVDVSDGEKGLAYLHQGTFKHWVKDQTLVNLFAWGEETNAIGDRMGRDNWAKSFDQRLRGKHTIHSAIYPHMGDWRAAGLPAVARFFAMPPVGCVAELHDGHLPPRVSLLQLTEPEVMSTGIRTDDAQLICRLYSVSNKTVPVSIVADRLRVSALQILGGKVVSELRPFQIGTLALQSVE